MKARVTDDPGEVRPVGLALFTVKTYHHNAAIPVMRPVVGWVITVLTFSKTATFPKRS